MEVRTLVLLLVSIIIVSIFSGCINLKTSDPADSKTLDSDNDGVLNYLDDFPFDPFEQHDSDGDGTGDNGDKDKTLHNGTQAIF